MLFLSLCSVSSLNWSPLPCQALVSDIFEVSMEHEPWSSVWQTCTSQFSSKHGSKATQYLSSKCGVHHQIELKMHLDIDHLVHAEWLLCFYTARIYSPSPYMAAILMYWSTHPLLDPCKSLNILSVLQRQFEWLIAESAELKMLQHTS